MLVNEHSEPDFNATMRPSALCGTVGLQATRYKLLTMSIDLTQFYQIFFEETAEHLAAMESLLLGLDVSNPSMDDLNAIFRAAHSIKGGAGTFGFNDMAEVTHTLESLLDKLRKREMALADEMVSAFLEAGDVISMQLAAHRGEGEADAGAVRAMHEKLERLASAAQPAPASPSAGERNALLPGGRTSSPEQDEGFLDELPDASASAPTLPGEKPPEEPPDPGYGFFEAAEGPLRPPSRGGTPDTRPSGGLGAGSGAPTGGVNSASSLLDSRLPTLGVPLAGEAQLSKPATATVAAPVAPQHDTGRHAGEAPASGPECAPFGRRATDNKQEAQQAEATSIRVSVEKVDQLVNLMGELVITRAMLAQSALQVNGADNENLQSNLHQLERNTRDLQEAVMSIRMMPVSFVFSRFPRMVHDLAAKLNKQVEIKMLGENTELDKGLIEKISDPLTHLVRNSLDHGIEAPEKRTAAGKPPCGTITLKASHQGGNVVIEVSDDGAGLNRSKLLSKAKQSGLLLRDEMSDQDVWALIMEPGFSTAEVVTDVSGRGVGMDVVKRNIAGLGGRVELDSVEGLGTRVIIRLPLTLAIMDGFSVSVGHETYIVPLNAIVESLPGSAADIKRAGGGGLLLRVRGEYLPVVALHQVFGIEAGIKEPERGILVLLEAEGRKIALLVDELTGQHQVVLKNLESNFRKVPYVSGATIMGDGRVALILDVAALVSEDRGQRAEGRGQINSAG